MASKALGKNPLFKTEPETEPVEEREELAQIEEPEEFTTMTFKVRKSYLHTLRNYAYTNRLEIQGALDQILTDFFGNIDLTTLLEAPEKTKKTRRKKNRATTSCSSAERLHSQSFSVLRSS